MISFWNEVEEKLNECSVEFQEMQMLISMLTIVLSSFCVIYLCLGAFLKLLIKPADVQGD